MYNSHPAPPGLQVTMEKQQVLYRLYTLVYILTTIMYETSDFFTL